MGDDISNPILERVYEAVDVNGITEKITLRVGKPYSVSESSSRLKWRCPFQIIGIGSEKIHEGPGIDTIDALFNSLRIAEALLDSYSKHSKKRITWLNEDDLGLSTNFSPLQDDQPTETMIDLEDTFKTAFDEFFRNRDSK